jgi:integrase/recombinase XerD
MKKYQPKTMEYRELLAACRAELATLGYGASTVRLNGAGELLQWLEERGRVGIAGLGRADLMAFLDYLQTRPSRRGGALSLYTVKGYVFSISLLFDYAERHGLRGGSPLAGLSLPALPISSRYVASREEIAKLYTTASGDDRARAVLHLLYACGLRRNEAERLNVGDVDYGTALLYVRSGKGKKRRVIPLTETVATGLKEYQKQDRWRWVGERSGKAFLLNDRGGRMLGATIARQLKDLVGEAKVSSKITPHVLRHAVATHLVGGGMDLERVRDFLGHEHLETTQIYAHIKADDV